ncbi:AGAP000666-PA-like protein [Anopheles sinensis]|uniref:Ubiquitin carboxyl-terminal hydrolase n=1 Tax=Anopheles sinensis TaxID=74873 RepID=A0A084WU26_ANOSI|nr:AGAP000666-PA-like protein [Anopheles sinensis]
MGKRHREYRDDGGSSTESNDDAQTTSKLNGGEVCNHITKAQIDLLTVRKSVKTSGFDRFCSKCTQEPRVHQPETASNVANFNLWLCLKCGTQLCGRDKHEHAVQHFTQFVEHSLALNTTTFDLWCYSCSVKVDPNVKPKLLEIVRFAKGEVVKQQNSNGAQSVEEKLQLSTESVRKMVIDVSLAMPVVGNASTDVPNTTKPASSSSTSSNQMQDKRASSVGGVLTISSPSTKDTQNASIAMPAKPFSIDSLPRVRGLSNLGNTCFFNAVLQCLARTPYLLTILKQSVVEGGKVHIPGGVLKLEDGEIELPPIDGELGAWRSLTGALADILAQLSDSATGVISPKRLLSELTTKWPQFAGGQQHDSHELLRQLLESVRTEDEKRYTTLILNTLRPGRRNSDDARDENLKAKVRFYGDQISQGALRPEQIFRGSLVSTLTCQDCHHTSSRHEYFLDISLPVCVDKPQPPATTGAGARTKSATKKERLREKKAKRIAKQQKNRKNLSSDAGIGDGPDDGNADGPQMVPLTDDLPGDDGGDDDQSSDDSNEPSDADVEDNDVTDDPLSKGGDDVDQVLVGDQNANQSPEKMDEAPENQNKESENGGAKGTRMVRQRTYSHADWSNTIAPRYQCEDGEYSVQSCFNNFTTLELMTGNNKVCCEACTEQINGKDGKSVNTNATKQFLISVPPAVLILHLKRFQVGPRGLFKKITKAVTFPFVLDIAPFCGSKVKRAAHVRPGQKKILYALYGLVEHSGSMHGGHYVAYVKVRPPIDSHDVRWKFIPQGTKDELDRKSEQEMAKEQARRMMGVQLANGTDGSPEKATEDSGPPQEEGAVGYGTEKPQESSIPDVEPPPGKWYYVSDSFVREVSEENVLNVQAYLLFYERIF